MNQRCLLGMHSVSRIASEFMSHNAIFTADDNAQSNVQQCATCKYNMRYAGVASKCVHHWPVKLYCVDKTKMLGAALYQLQHKFTYNVGNVLNDNCHMTKASVQHVQNSQ